MLNLNGIRHYDVLDLDGKALVSRLKSLDNLVLLVGSIISEWHPSNIPSGITTTNQIAALLASRFPDSDKHDDIVKYISRAPFEYILDRCPDEATMRSLLQDIYNVSTANSAHKAIANLAHKGFLHSIITPNYDLCLDTLLPDGAPLKHVVEHSDITGLDADTRIFYKIHGCASPGRSASMVLTLSQEGVLPKWKQDVLTKCLNGKTLLVMGFSGLDFEISPHILKSNVGAVIWNSYRNPRHDPSALTPNALRIITSSKAEIIHGDLRHILAELDAPYIWNNSSGSLSDVGDMFSKKMKFDEISSWSASVLSSPGYARFAETIAKELGARVSKGSEQWANAVHLMGDSQYSSGRYSESSSNATKAFDTFQELGNLNRAISSAAKSVAALRCIGRFKEAYEQLHNTREILKLLPKEDYDRLRVKLELQEVLILREQYSRAKILSRFGLRWMIPKKQHYQDRARVLLKRVCEISEQYGQWHDLQQCRMWSNRLDIPFDEVYFGDLQPLDDLAGWNHLGHMVPEMMSLRGSLLKRNYQEAPKQKVINFIHIAEDIGCYPEVWKLTLSKWRHYGWSQSDSLISWTRAFCRCNYTLVMRTFKFLFEEYR